ncbi:MAG: hypothetical protein QOH09_4920 [Pseudonocardiales bacterium]|jgi:hypothetical protein|nr:hypothetical protein [Pseudonocardiales bacterium]
MGPVRGCDVGSRFRFRYGSATAARVTDRDRNPGGTLRRVSAARGSTSEAAHPYTVKSQIPRSDSKALGL